MTKWQSDLVLKIWISDIQREKLIMGMNSIVTRSATANTSVLLQYKMGWSYDFVIK